MLLDTTGKCLRQLGTVGFLIFTLLSSCHLVLGQNSPSRHTSVDIVLKAAPVGPGAAVLQTGSLHKAIVCDEAGFRMALADPSITEINLNVRRLQLTQAFWKDFERTLLLISRSVLVQPNPTNTSLPPFPILDFNYMTSAAQLADNVTVSFKELEIQNSQVRMPFGFFWSLASNSTIKAESCLNLLQVAMPVNYGTKFWSATQRPLGMHGEQLFSYVPRLCLPHNRTRCYDWALNFLDVIFAAPPSPDPVNATKLVGGYQTSYQNTWSYGDVVVDEECPVVRPLYECIMAARSRLPGGGKPANASAPAAGKAAMTATQPDPDRRTRNRALLIALPLAIGVPALVVAALLAYWCSQPVTLGPMMDPDYSEHGSSLMDATNPASSSTTRFMVLLSSLASSLPPALRPRGLHGSRGTWTFPLLDGLPTSGAARRMAGRGSGDAGQLAMGPDGIRLGGLIGAGSFGRVFEGLWRGRRVAVKLLSHSAAEGARVARELALSITLTHANIITTLYTHQETVAEVQAAQTTDATATATATATVPATPAPQALADAKGSATTAGSGSPVTAESTLMPLPTSTKRVSAFATATSAAAAAADPTVDAASMLVSMVTGSSAPPNTPTQPSKNLSDPLMSTSNARVTADAAAAIFSSSHATTSGAVASLTSRASGRIQSLNSVGPAKPEITAAVVNISPPDVPKNDQATKTGATALKASKGGLAKAHANSAAAAIAAAGVCDVDTAAKSMAAAAATSAVVMEVNMEAPVPAAISDIPITPEAEQWFSQPPAAKDAPVSMHTELVPRSADSAVRAAVPVPDAGGVSHCMGEGARTWIVQELAEGGSLAAAVSRGALRMVDEQLDLTMLLAYAHDVSAGMAYLHGRNIIHGDLKLENVLLKSDTPLDAALALQAASGRTKPASVVFGMGWPRSTASAPGSKAGPASVAGGGSMGRVSAGASPALTPAGSVHTTKPRYTAKVADFGLSRMLDPSVTHAVTRSVGTISHAAPELLATGTARHSADVYAFGICLWHMCTGKRPFAGMTHAEVLMAVMNGRRPWHFMRPTALPLPLPAPFAPDSAGSNAFDAADAPRSSKGSGNRLIKAAASSAISWASRTATPAGNTPAASRPVSAAGSDTKFTRGGAGSHAMSSNTPLDTPTKVHNALAGTGLGMGGMDGLPEQLAELIEECTQQDPADRPSFDDICYRLDCLALPCIAVWQ